MALPTQGAFGLEAEANSSPAALQWRVHPKEWLEKEIDLRGKTWSEVSRYFYSDRPNFGARLRRLNGGQRGIAIQKTRLRYFKPQIQVQRGDYLEQLGKRWVGNSHQAYRVLLELNPQIVDPDHLQPGIWLTVPRIPAKAAEARTTRLAGTAPSADAVFIPSSAEERIALARWYLNRLDPEALAKPEKASERKRADELALRLEKEAAGGHTPSWEPAYAAAQYYVKTRQEKSLTLRALELALRDPQAPIQVAALYLRLRGQSQKPLSAKEKEQIVSRFPGLQGLFEESESETP